MNASRSSLRLLLDNLIQKLTPKMERKFLSFSADLDSYRISLIKSKSSSESKSKLGMSTFEKNNTTNDSFLKNMYGSNPASSRQFLSFTQYNQKYRTIALVHYGHFLKKKRKNSKNLCAQK